MAWPTITGLITDHLDSGTDSPALARPAILKAVQAVIAIIGSRGTASGVASLDGDGKIPDAELGKGEANGVCDLNASGKVPSDRYDRATAGDGVAITAGVLSHADTSSATSQATSDGYVVTGVTVDKFGHVTDISTSAVVTSMRYSGSDLQMYLGGVWATVPTVAS